MVAAAARWGVLLVGGMRSHQENYAEAFRADPRCRLVAVSEERNAPPERKAACRELAGALGVPYIEDLDEALARDDVSVVSVCSEFERRARVAERAARAGKHLYLDKPLATTVEDGERLVRAVEEAGVRSQMFSFVHTPWALYAREVVSSGRIGKLAALHTDVLFAKGPAGTADLSRPRRETYPPRRFTFPDVKRELFTTGVYAIGLLRWLSGRRPVRIFAVTSNYFFAEHQRRDVEDFAALSLEFEGGLGATVTGGRIGWLSDPGSGPIRVHLIGERGSRLVDAAQPRLVIESDAPEWRPGPPLPEDPMGFWASTARAMRVEKRRWRVFAAPARSDASRFIDCLEEGRRPEVDAREGVEILKALLAAYESAARGEPVTL